MSRDWFYVFDDNEFESRRDAMLSKMNKSNDIEWLPELPIDQIFTRLKQEFPGITKNGGPTNFFWCSDLTSYEDDVLLEYGELPSSPWSSDDGEGFELSLHRGYAQFNGTGTSDDVASKLDEIFREFNCKPVW